MRTPAAVCLLIVSNLVPAPGGAADYRPNLYDDPAPDGCSAGHCSLREAILAANASAGPDRILLSAGIYAIQIAGSGEDAGATGDLDVTDDLEIVGPAATMTAIDGNSFDRILHVAGGEVDFTLRGVALGAGFTDGFGTALLVENVASALIEECVFAGNYDADEGNQQEGAVEIRGSGFVATLRRSTISDNGGTGLDVAQAEVVVENSTFVANTYEQVVASDGATIACTHCTVHTDGNPNFEVEATDGDSSITLVNSLLVGDCDELSEGTVTAAGGNLESPGTTCGLETDGVETNLLLLQELGDSGGPTPTMLPEPAGAPVNIADDSQCLATDQRGLARPATQCDIGATEEETEELLARPATPILHDGFEQGNPGAWVVVG